MKFILVTGILVVAGNSYSQMNWRKVKEEFILTNAPFKACHSSTLVETTPNKISVAFFGGSHEGDKDVSIWLTSQYNKEWLKPVCVAEGYTNDSLRFPCWNPVLFKSRNGTLFLFYKVGPNPREWWGMVSTSANDGKTWSPAKKLPDGFIGPVKNKPVQLKDGTILSPSSVETNESWKAHIETSSDSGKTWEMIRLDTNTQFKIIQPTILTYSNNQLQLLCRSDQDRIVEAWSSDNGKTWGRFSKLEVYNPNLGIDAVTLKSGWQLLVYNPAISGKEWFNNRGKLNVAVSRDGKNWKDVFVLEDSNDQEFSYPAVIQTQDGAIHITYTFKRENIKHVVLLEK